MPALHPAKDEMEGGALEAPGNEFEEGTEMAVIQVWQIGEQVLQQMHLRDDIHVEIGNQVLVRWRSMAG